MATFMLLRDCDRARQIWQNFRDEIMEDWVQRQPCTRPLAWWECDAPTAPIPRCREFQAAQRRRLGGIGIPQHEVIAVWPRFERGIPAAWFDAEGAATFGGVALDEANPPRFESEAMYLDRHDFLTPAERRHLESHPELLTPEVVTFDDDGGDDES